MSEVQVYRYGRGSALDAPSGVLELATSGGVTLRAPTRHPQFFTGFLTRPYVAAAGLGAVARVAAASYVRRSAGAFRYGGSVKTVQARLGHASAAETLDTYSHLWPDSDDRTREAIDSVLGPRQTPRHPELER